MKRASLGLGILLALLGAVWVAQGLGFLPGSFMTSQIFWAYMGALALAAGGVLIFLGVRRASAP